MWLLLQLCYSNLLTIDTNFRGGEAEVHESSWINWHWRHLAKNACEREWVWSPKCTRTWVGVVAKHWHDCYYNYYACWLNVCYIHVRTLMAQKLAVMARAVEASGFAWRAASGIGGKLLISERSRLKSCLCSDWDLSSSVGMIKSSISCDQRVFLQEINHVLGKS